MTLLQSDVFQLNDFYINSDVSSLQALGPRPLAERWELELTVRAKRI
jgi:hypothetical protein